MLDYLRKRWILGVEKAPWRCPVLLRGDDKNIWHCLNVNILRLVRGRERERHKERERRGLKFEV